MDCVFFAGAAAGFFACAWFDVADWFAAAFGAAAGAFLAAVAFGDGAEASSSSLDSGCGFLDAVTAFGTGFLVPIGVRFAAGFEEVVDFAADAGCLVDKLD